MVILMMFEGEIFIPISGEQGYFICKSGKVLSCLSTKPRILKPKIDGKKYAFVNLGRGNNCYRNKKIHRLVAEAFIPNPENKPQINHIDGNKANNNVKNLEWATQSENIRHAFLLGLNKPQKGSQQAQSKLNESDVLSIRQIYESGGATKKQLATKYGVSDTLIHYIIIRRNWKHI